MTAPHLILIYGSSIFLLAVGASLTTQPGVVVAYHAPHHPRPPEQLPHAVLFQHGQPLSLPLWALLRAGVPLLELDAAHQQVTILQARQAPFAHVNDLLAVVS